MTDMEKKVMVRLCAKILTETDLYDTDKEVQNLIDWVLVSEQIEPDCRARVKEKLERMKELCKERNSLYEKQNDLKGQKWKLEKALER